MVETNVLDNRLQTGKVEMPALVGAVKDSGVVDDSRKVNSNKKPLPGKVNKLVNTRSLRCFAIVVARRDCVHNLSLRTQKV